MLACFMGWALWETPLPWQIRQVTDTCPHPDGWLTTHTSPTLRYFCKPLSVLNNGKGLKNPQPRTAIVYDTSARQPACSGANMTMWRFTALGYWYFSWGITIPGGITIATIKHNPGTLTKQTQTFTTNLENRLSVFIQVHKCRYAMATCSISFIS